MTRVAEWVSGTIIDDRTVRRHRSDAEDRVLLVVLAREVDRGVERWPVWTELKPAVDFIKRVKTSKAGLGLSQVGGLRCGRVPREPVNEVLDAVV